MAKMSFKEWITYCIRVGIAARDSGVSPMAFPHCRWMPEQGQHHWSIVASQTAPSYVASEATGHVHVVLPHES